MTADVIECKIAFVNQSIWYCLLTVSYLHELSSCQQQCCGVCQVFPCNTDPSGHFVVHFGKSSSSTCGRVKSVPRPGFKDDQVWWEGGARDKSSTSHKSNSQVVDDVAVQVWHHLHLSCQVLTVRMHLSFYHHVKLLRLWDDLHAGVVHDHRLKDYVWIKLGHLNIFKDFKRLSQQPPPDSSEGRDHHQASWYLPCGHMSPNLKEINTRGKY